MHLVLAIPGLLGVDASGAARAAPGLARLLRRAGKPRLEPDGLSAALAALYGVTRQRDWPLAPLMAQAAGIEPGPAYWLRATPITLIAGRDDVRLSGSVRDLTEVAASTLVAGLNTHFITDGLHFIAPAPDEWLLRADREPALTTRPLATVIGEPLRTLLPTGADASLWRRWEHEIQMLLHEHPVNEERARNGQPPVSSVWFHEGGRRISPPPAPRIATFGGDAVIAALARHVGAPAQPLPVALPALLGAQMRDVDHLVVCTRITDRTVFETGFAHPAWRELLRGTLASVTVIGDGGSGHAAVWTATRPAFLGRLLARKAPPSVDSLIAQASEKA